MNFVTYRCCCTGVLKFSASSRTFDKIEEGGPLPPFGATGNVDVSKNNKKFQKLMLTIRSFLFHK